MGTPRAREKATMPSHTSACSSSQMPVSQGLIRPSGTTAVDSVITSPAPPMARLPRCTRCQSLGRPGRAGSQEYWHIGETHARLAKVAPAKVRGLKSRDTRLLDDERFGGVGER